MKIKIHYFIIGLCIYIPSEDFFLKYIPISDKNLVLLRFASEIIIYMALLYVVGIKVFYKQLTVKLKQLDVIILFLSFVLLTSFLINDCRFLHSIKNIRPLIRFIPLYYLILALNFSNEKIQSILNWVFMFGIFQIFLGMAQYFMGAEINEYFIPKRVDYELIGQAKKYVLHGRGRELGSIFGMLGDTIHYAQFMIVIFSLYLCFKLPHKHYEQSSRMRLGVPKFFKLFASGLVFCAILFVLLASYVRMAFFLVLILLASHLFILKKYKSFFAIVLCVLVLIFGFSIKKESLYKGSPKQYENSFIENVLGIFSGEYLEIAKKQRLSYLLENPYVVIKNAPLLGYGPDSERTLEKINSDGASVFKFTRKKVGFEDVFWSAILSYYGILGLLSILFIFLVLGRQALFLIRQKDRFQVSLGFFGMYIFISTIFISFFNAALKFKTYGFYFWLISALVSTIYYQRKKEMSLEVYSS